MSISFNHPKNTVTSTDTLTINVLGGSVTSPKPLRLSATSVIMPVGRQPVGEAGAIMYDSSSNVMKYFNGTAWVEWRSATEILKPVNDDIADIIKRLGTKIDSVTYSSSAVPAATISGTNLNIVFPNGTAQTGQAGLFTTAPSGSIQYYSLVSGQTMSSVREQMGGAEGSQNGRNGTQASPYVSKTGWCLSDGAWWTWQGSTGTITKQVPALNNTAAYFKSTGSSGVTKTDGVIGSSGSIGGTAITVAQMPSHSFSVSGSTNVAGSHNHAIKTGSQRMSIDDVRGNWFRDTSQTNYTEYAGDHSHTFSGSTNALGSNQAHTHALNDVDVAHFNVAVLYNIAEPALALSQTAGDARYVLKSGDTMTGALTVQSSATIRDDQTNLAFWFRNNAGTERAAIYHSTGTNTLRFRSNGGAEVSINTAGLLNAPNVTTGTMTSSTLVVSGAASTGALNVSGQITATGDIWAFSDANLKENIRPIQNATSIVNQIQGVLGNFIADEDKTTKSMFIAQEIQKVYPYAVTEDENGFLKVNYQAMIPLLFAAFNEQHGAK